jgi:hypothetical protein
VQSRIPATLFLATFVALAATAALTSTAAADGAPPAPGVIRVMHGPVNIEQAFKVTHCIIHYELGTYDGTAYAKVRATSEDHGYACTTESQVAAARGARVVNGPLSRFTCGESVRRSCDPGVFLKWAQSSLSNATGFGAYVKINELRRYPPAWQQDRITLSAFAPAAQPNDASCTNADLAQGTFAMPTPRRVEHHIALNDGQDILDPPTLTKPSVTAAQAWKTGTKFGLLTPARHGRYELWLGNLTSYRRYVNPPTWRSVSHPVWMIVGRDVPIFPISGGPALPPGVTRPPQPPCYFGNVIQPIDATTGRSLFWESGLPQVP